MPDNIVHHKRVQLTLFVNETDSIAIETIRQRFNPQQYVLIKSHVTLCREDELEEMESVLQNLSLLKYSPVTVHFGHTKRFSEGKGVLMPAIGDTEQFQRLRKIILQDIINNPRIHEPHITLMHPRNSTCTNAIFEEIQKLKLPRKIIFRKISLIEQEPGKEWKVLKEFDLK